MKNKISYAVSVILIIAITMLLAFTFSKLNTKQGGGTEIEQEVTATAELFPSEISEF